MVDAKRLLADLKKQRKRLEDDLRQYHAASPGRNAVQAEWRAAFDARRTADTFETFWSAALDQAAVHWILGVVFLRFLEDNGLVDRPLLSGPGERLELAQLRQRAFFRARPQDSDAEYLLQTFAEAACLPGLAGLYDPDHNPLFRLPISGDGAMALLGFFRDRVPETGALVHDFTDPAWGTRFLGDLYQDLSEDARKRFALLQTPEFVEEWILDRTLEPAIGEFGHAAVRMIDPACGSGHFLLGGFARLLCEWQRHAPDMPPAAQAQRALDAVAGVDLNPFAVEIARFRLLLAALRAAGETGLAAAPDFRFSLAVGDSLFHGRHFFRHELGGAAEGFGHVMPHHYDAEDTVELDRLLGRQQLGGAAEGFGHVMPHHYDAEDTVELDRLLGRQYHAVVGNPPYITPKDAAMRDAYRGIYPSCHRSYALAVPFIERFFDLAQIGTDALAAGFVGMIVANSFMKREFGSKLIEAVLPRLDLTHVVDCSGAYIPGHGTPTAILFGRNRAPVGSVVRAVMGIRGEPTAPDDPASGLVWSAIVAQTDQVGSQSEFVSVADMPRATLHRHPWSIGGGGAADLKELIEQSTQQRLSSVCTEIGRTTHTGEDDFFVVEREADFPGFSVPLVLGEDVRDYVVYRGLRTIFPYDKITGHIVSSIPHEFSQHAWKYRTGLRARRDFGQTIEERGLQWFEHNMFFPHRWLSPLSITFAFVATHNHFVLDRGGKVFNRSAPVIKLPTGANEEDHLGLLGLLNSSTACFWMKQVCHSKGGQGINEGAKAEMWERFIEVTATHLESFPLASSPPLDLARALDTEAQRLSENLPTAVVARATPLRATLNEARAAAQTSRARMIALEEELDWRCYRLYGLLDDAPEHPDPPGLHLGERAFEIVMARHMAEGTLQTAWFERHRSTPITELPAHWPADYRAVVERRIVLIENDQNIGLIERPEYKRRWSMEPWEDMEQKALRSWLLDRLEDRCYWPAEDPRVISTRTLADAARHDADFLAVAALHVGRDAFDLDALVAELVGKESVPFLAALRYSDSGQRKRADWEATWDKQRAEDAIDADAASAAEAKRRKQAEVGDIPVPPKYRTPDFLSQDFWRLRGGLDVPKERFVSFPHCARDAEDSLPVLWAGHDHLARARAIAAWYVERKDTDGWGAARLTPLLAGLLELVPWLKQWHNGIDADTGLRMGDFFAGFVEEEARGLGLTLADLRAWTPPAPTRKPRGRRAAA
jgi:hypothetical protein